MDPIERHERKRKAWLRLRAQRRRAGELRGRVVAISLIAFVLLWAIVFAQMATGNDPVLGEKSSARKAAAAESRRSAIPLEEVEAPVVGPVTPEPERSEPEPIEPDVVEPEPIEPEPEPLVTSQS